METTLGVIGCTVVATCMCVAVAWCIICLIGLGRCGGGSSRGICRTGAPNDECATADAGEKVESRPTTDEAAGPPGEERPFIGVRRPMYLDSSSRFDAATVSFKLRPFVGDPTEAEAREVDDSRRNIVFGWACAGIELFAPACAREADKIA